MVWQGSGEHHERNRQSTPQERRPRRIRQQPAQPAQPGPPAAARRPGGGPQRPPDALPPVPAAARRMSARGDRRNASSLPQRHDGSAPGEHPARRSLPGRSVRRDPAVNAAGGGVSQANLAERPGLSSRTNGHARRQRRLRRPAASTAPPPVPPSPRPCALLPGPFVAHRPQPRPSSMAQGFTPPRHDGRRRSDPREFPSQGWRAAAASRWAQRRHRLAARDLPTRNHVPFAGAAAAGRRREPRSGPLRAARIPG